MIEALHTGMMANVNVGGEVSESSSVTNRIKHVHLSANYARDPGTITVCPCRLNASYTVQSCCPLSYREPRPGQCTDDR